MLLGMTLLVCDSSFDLIMPHVLYHSTRVDMIVCSANNPSRSLLTLIELISLKVKNFYFLGSFEGKHSADLQTFIVNKMVYFLKEKGCDWVVNSDDDEFFTGRDIKESINDLQKNNNFNVLYQDGFHYYSTEEDREDLSPVRRMTYRDPEGIDYNCRKAIHKTEGFVSVTPGNHWVTYSDGSFKPVKDSGIIIRHYSHRNKKLPYDARELYLNLNANQISEKNLVKDEYLITLFNDLGIP